MEIVKAVGAKRDTKSYTRTVEFNSVVLQIMRHDGGPAYVTLNKGSGRMEVTPSDLISIAEIMKQEFE